MTEQEILSLLASLKEYWSLLPLTLSHQTIADRLDLQQHWLYITKEKLFCIIPEGPK